MTHRVAIVLSIVCDNSPVMLLEKGNGMTHIVFNHVPKSFFILESLLKFISTYIAKRPVTSPRPQGREHNVTVDASVRHFSGALLSAPGCPSSSQKTQF